MAVEVQAAARMGLNRVKLFPADAVDAAACLRAYASVYPAMRFMPSGGIELANVTRYLSFTSVFAVSGSWIPAVVHDGAGSVAGACRAAEAAGSSNRIRIRSSFSVSRGGSVMIRLVNPRRVARWSVAQVRREVTECDQRV